MTKPEHISLRDYFAAHAINGLLINKEILNINCDDFVEFAYEIADMMLELSARENQDE